MNILTLMTAQLPEDIGYQQVFSIPESRFVFTNSKFVR